MKKYLLILMAVLGVLLTSVATAQWSPQQMLIMKHVNPMPNLMQLVVKHEDELKLSDEQKAALEAWRKEAQPKMMEMAKTVIKLEKQLHDAALAGASGAVLQEIATRIFNVRGAIIKQKLACRNRMAQILGLEKMKQVIELYKQQFKEESAEA